MERFQKQSGAKNGLDAPVEVLGHWSNTNNNKLRQTALTDDVNCWESHVALQYRTVVLLPGGVSEPQGENLNGLECGFLGASWCCGVQGARPILIPMVPGVGLSWERLCDGGTGWVVLLWQPSELLSHWKFPKKC